MTNADIKREEKKRKGSYEEEAIDHKAETLDYDHREEKEVRLLP
jgi:hypothetical protein